MAHFIVLSTSAGKQLAMNKQIKRTDSSWGSRKN